MGCRLRTLAILMVMVLAPAAASAATAATTKPRHCPRGTRRHGRRCVPVAPARPRPAKGPSSFDRLSAAISQHRLSAATAALYEAYAVFGDRRLPPGFRGKGALTQDQAELALRDVESAYRSLPVATRAKLRPFFIPPFLKGSWFSSRYRLHARRAGASSGAIGPGWRSVNSSVAQVWWYSDWKGAAWDQSVARAAADELASHIWPVETKLMGRKPLPVRGLGFDGDRLQILIMPGIDVNPFNPPPAGLTLPWSGGCEKGPRYIELSDVSYGHIVLAHEFFHTLVAAFDHLNCTDDRWWDEGTARWVETYVYPPTDPYFDSDAKQYIDGEAGHGGGYPYALPDPGSWPRRDGEHDYYSAAFAYYLAKQFGPEVIRKTWAGAGTERIANSIDTAVGSDGGLDRVWPQFGLQLTNLGDPWDDFHRWLGYDESSTAAADTTGTANAADSPVELGKGGELEQTGVPPLGFKVYDYKITDAATHSVEFFNPWDAPPPGLSIHGLFHSSQGWVEEDWTQTPDRLFCRQVPQGNVDRIVVVIGNSQPYSEPIRLPAGRYPELISTRAGCRGYGGTFSGTERYDDGSRTYTASWTAQVHWTAPQSAAATGDVYFNLDPGGTLHYQGLSGNENGCTLSAPPEDVPLDPALTTLQVSYGAPSWGPSPDGSPFSANFIAAGSVDVGSIQIAGKETCPDGTNDVTFTMPEFVLQSSSPYTDGRSHLKAVGGTGSISGSETYPVGNNQQDQVTTNWGFNADG